MLKRRKTGPKLLKFAPGCRKLVSSSARTGDVDTDFDPFGELATVRTIIQMRNSPFECFAAYSADIIRSRSKQAAR